MLGQSRLGLFDTFGDEGNGPRQGCAGIKSRQQISRQSGGEHVTGAVERGVGAGGGQGELLPGLKMLVHDADLALAKVHAGDHRAAASQIRKTGQQCFHFLVIVLIPRVGNICQ